MIDNLFQIFQELIRLCSESSMLQDLLFLFYSLLIVFLSCSIVKGITRHA